MQQNHSLVSIKICLPCKNSLTRSTSSELHTSRPLYIKMQQVVFLFVCSAFMLSRIKRKLTQLGIHPFRLILCFKRIIRKVLIILSLCDLQFISSSTGDNWLCWMTFKVPSNYRSLRVSDVAERA